MQRRQLLALACSFLLIQSSSWALAEELAKPVPTKPVPVQQIRLVDDLVCGSAFDSGYRKSRLDAAKANRKKDRTLALGAVCLEPDDYAKFELLAEEEGLL